jgi:hypothetical protein
MTPDEQHALYMNALQEAQKHMKSAPETIERFNDIEKKMISIEGKIDTLLLFQEKIDNHLEKLNGKVAKHNDWINLNHKTVTEDVPKLNKQVADNSKKIYAGIVILGLIQFLINKII